MSFIEGTKSYYRLCGLRGVAAIFTFRLFGFPREVSSIPAGMAHPVHLRTRSTDVAVFLEIFTRCQYDVDLPFSPRFILDAGANVGLASVFFAGRYPDATILAVEPEPDNFELLQRNVAPWPHVIPVRAALWNKDRWIEVSPPDSATGAYGSWGFVTHETSGTPNVRAVTIRSLMCEHGVPAFDLAKVDIEGAESEIFEDADWLAGVRFLMIEFHERLRPGCSAPALSATRGWGSVPRGDMTFLTPPVDKHPVATSSPAPPIREIPA